MSATDEASATDRQARVIAFLSDPATYAGPPLPVERHETHGAIVFLAGREAIKIKRAVRFPYMDLSTLEKRGAMCLREVEVNRRFAPDLYLGCVPITRDRRGKLSFGGSGEIVEWAVRMRRFEQSALLSSIAESGGIDAPLARAVADTVFEAHAAAERRYPSGARAGLTGLIGSVAANVAALDAFPRDQAARFGGQLRAAAERAMGILEQRAAQGFVRRCHGDLHLGNVVLWDGRPVLFDALEFDEDLATIDTLYDLAFLLMDLDCRGGRAAANIVLNRYLWRSGSLLDLAGTQALPLFLALRAGVRAMVTAERATLEAAERKARDVAAARRYFAAANSYLAPPAPCLVAVGGLSGTGKSTLAAALAAELGPAPGAVHLRSDLERKRLAGAAETERLSAEWYEEAVTAEVYRIVGAKARETVAAGHAAIVDAVYGRTAEREAIAAVARQTGTPFVGLWLTAPARFLLERVGGRSGDASDATADVVRQQLARATGPLTPDWVEIDAAGSPEETRERARRALRERRAEHGTGSAHAGNGAGDTRDSPAGG